MAYNFRVNRHYAQNPSLDYMLVSQNGIFFDSIKEIKEAIENDKNLDDLYDYGDYAEYHVLDINTKETMTIRAFNIVTYSLGFDMY